MIVKLFDEICSGIHNLTNMSKTDWVELRRQDHATAIRADSSCKYILHMAPAQGDRG